MKDFRVEWVIEVNAESFEGAALRALETQRDPTSIATVFTVSDGEEVRSVDVDRDVFSLERLKRVGLGEVFAAGVETGADGLLDRPVGDARVWWVATRGYAPLSPDWAVYCKLVAPGAANPVPNKHEVALHGSKLYCEHNIRRLVPCTDEMFETYRR